MGKIRINKKPGGKKTNRRGREKSCSHRGVMVHSHVLYQTLGPSACGAVPLPRLWIRCLCRVCGHGTSRQCLHSLIRNPCSVIWQEMHSLAQFAWQWDLVPLSMLSHAGRKGMLTLSALAPSGGSASWSKLQLLQRSEVQSMLLLMKHVGLEHVGNSLHLAW